MKKELGIFLILAAVCLAVGWSTPNFYSPYNVKNLSTLIGMFGIFGVGLALVIISGGIDLSVGSVFALLGVTLYIMLREWHWPWPIATAVIVAGAACLGAIHAFLITKVRLQSFIVTLCGMLIYRSVARYIISDASAGFGAENFGVFRALASGRVGIPFTRYVIGAPFVAFVAVAAIMWVVLHRSVYGRYLFAVGRNEDAARYSGINSKLVVAGAYVLCTVLAAFSGILFAIDTNTIQASDFGIGYEMYGIAAAVLGGCSLRGGEGSILGVVIGTALLQVLQNAVNLLGIPSSLNFAVMGGVILVGVLADQILAQRRAHRKQLTKAA
ncbi:MAG TPA: ABC transporter permease [Pirellulales bacterium]|nr:ABC transporter permease [Pirellulales bacterium]